MSELRQYNADALFIFPLIADGAQDFVTDYTPAAGDAKVWTDKLISTNPTALILGFDSLSELPVAGDQLDENGAGTAEGVVAFTVIVSGTVGGGTAAGFFFMRSVTGQAWSNNDQIDINGGTANIATADSTTYDLAATAGLIGEIGNGLFAAALSPTEMSCAQGEIHIVDSATKAIEDQAIQFNTFGNASALMTIDFDDAVRAGLTALPNAAADAAGGLVISDAGGHDPDLMALAVGLENDAAAVGDPSTSESVMQYVKQLINLIAGTTGIGTMPSAADPANGINLFEMLRAAMGATFATATDSLEQLQADHVTIQSDADDLQTQVGTAGAGLTDLGGMSTGMKAEVNAEVDGALDTTIPELGVGVPATTPTIRTGLMLLYMPLRNKFDVATSGTDTMEVHNDAGTRIAQKLLTDAAGDYSEAKMTSGA